MAKKQYAVTVAWSQTDHETYLISAIDRSYIAGIIKSKLKGFHHIVSALEIIKNLDGELAQWLRNNIF